MIRKERNFENFVNEKIKNLAGATRENIIYANRIFDEFAQKNYKLSTDELIREAKQDEEPDEVILEVLQDWVNHMASKVNHSSLKVYASGINRYLKYQKIRLDLKDIEWPQLLREERYAISRNEILEILKTATYRKRGLYLCLISSGARPIEILGLKKSDFQLIKGKYNALIPARLTKKKMARTVFFSREATPYITRLINDCENDMPFTKSKNLQNAVQAEEKAFRKYCDKLGQTDPRFTARYETTKYFKINMYCFRGYFFTHVMRVVGDDTAHAMIGHGAYLQQYQRRTTDEKKELWDELEPEILVYKDKQKEAKQHLEDKARDNRMDLLEKKLESMIKRLHLTSPIFSRQDPQAPQS